MSTIKITHQQPIANNVVNSHAPKKISIPSTTFSNSSSVTEPESVSETPVEESAEERRAKRREEYREASQIRERALQMQRKIEKEKKEVEQYYSLIQKAKEDPTVLAQAVGLTPEELQRKFFNKMYNIAEEKAPEKPETFEEATTRRLEQYEKFMQEDKERKIREAQEYGIRQAELIKHNFIRDNILPMITEDHEFIHKNGKEACAGTIYDLMNQVYQECQNSGKEFTLKAIDVIEQLEEELTSSAVSAMEDAKKVRKLSKYFREDSEDMIPRKNFMEERRSSPTLSSSYSAPPSALSSSNFNSSEPRLRLNDRNARRERAKRNLGQ